MNVTVAPAMEGVRWLFDALRFFARHPLHCGLWSAAYLAVNLFVLGVPIVGPLFFCVLFPTFYIGLIAALQAVDQGERPFLAVKQLNGRHYGSLAKLGGLLLVTVLVVAAAFVLTFVVINNLMPKMSLGEVWVMFFFFGFLLAVTAIPVVAIFTLSAFLLAWRDMRPLAALRAALAASLRNWRAALINGFCLTVLNGANVAILCNVAEIGVGDKIGSLFIVVMVEVLVFFLNCVNACFAYRSIFPEAIPPPLPSSLPSGEK